MNFKHQIKCRVRSHLLLRYNNWKRGQRQDVLRDVASHVSERYSLNSERLFKIFIGRRNFTLNFAVNTVAADSLALIDGRGFVGMMTAKFRLLYLYRSGGTLKVQSLRWDLTCYIFMYNAIIS